MKGNYKNMFKPTKFYIIVSNSSFIIKKEDDNHEIVIKLQSFIPNVPAYHHLHDVDKKDYIEDIKSQIKKLKIKDATIILPDDSIELEADKRIIIEFFLMSGVKKAEVNFQCFFMSFDNKEYISISKTSRVIVLQHIVYNKSIAKKYYDKNCTNMDQIIADVKNIYNDYTYSAMPVYINNINDDMEGFKDIGNLISVQDFINNIMNNKINN